MNPFERWFGGGSAVEEAPETDDKVKKLENLRTQLGELENNMKIWAGDTPENRNADAMRHEQLSSAIEALEAELGLKKEGEPASEPEEFKYEVDEETELKIKELTDKVRG